MRLVALEDIQHMLRLFYAAAGFCRLFVFALLPGWGDFFRRPVGGLCVSPALFGDHVLSSYLSCVNANEAQCKTACKVGWIM